MRRAKELARVDATRGVGLGSTGLVGYEGTVRAEVHPTVEITFPPGRDGSDRLHQVFDLRHRCCTVNFLGHVRTPEAVGRGKADVTIRFDLWKEGRVSPSRHQVNVVAPTNSVKLEAVSPR